MAAFDIVLRVALVAIILKYLYDFPALKRAKLHEFIRSLKLKSIRAAALCMN
jgi:predicted transcriptional regulator